jgi:WD40 repeat protein
VAAGETSKVWDLETGKELMRLGEYRDYAWSVVFTPDGKRIIGGAGSLKVWDAASGSEVVAFGQTAQSIESVTISPDGQLIATGGTDDGLIRIWESSGPKDALQRHKGQSE